MFDKKAKAPKPTKEEKRDRKIPITKYTMGGRISCLIALSDVAVIALTLTLAIIQNGKSGIIVGVMGMIAFFVAVIGFVFGITSFNEGTKFVKYSYIGSVANAVIWIGIFLMYLTYV